MIEHMYLGIPLTCQKITPGNTVTTVAAGLWQYKEYEIGYDSGDYAFAEGDLIIGASSGAVGVVRSCTVVTGTVGGGDAAGKIRFHSWNGTNFTNNEKIKVGADSDVGDIDGTTPTACEDNYPFKEWIAKAVMVRAETQSQLVMAAARKILVDQTAKVGFILTTTGYPLFFWDAAAIKNLNVVDAAAGVAGSSVIIGYF